MFDLVHLVFALENFLKDTTRRYAFSKLHAKCCEQNSACRKLTRILFGETQCIARLPWTAVRVPLTRVGRSSSIINGSGLFFGLAKHRAELVGVSDFVNEEMVSVKHLRFIPSLLSLSKESAPRRRGFSTNRRPIPVFGDFRSSRRGFAKLTSSTKTRGEVESFEQIDPQIAA